MTLEMGSATGVVPDGRGHFVALLDTLPPRKESGGLPPGNINTHCYHMDQGRKWGDLLFPTGDVVHRLTTARTLRIITPARYAIRSAPMKKLALSMDEETIAQAERMAAEQGRPEGLVSAISFADVFYMMRRWADADTARQAVVLV